MGGVAEGERGLSSASSICNAVGCFPPLHLLSLSAPVFEVADITYGDAQGKPEEAVDGSGAVGDKHDYHGQVGLKVQCTKFAESKKTVCSLTWFYLVDKA